MEYKYKLKCPNCLKNMQHTKTNNRYNYDVWTCKDCAHIKVFDYFHN